MFHWNLRLVRNSMEWRPHIREVDYDEQGRPFGYSSARLLDMIRFFGEWSRAPRLRSPDDFNGELLADEEGRRWKRL